MDRIYTLFINDNGARKAVCILNVRIGMKRNNGLGG